MKKFSLVLASLLMATHAMAQNATSAAPEPAANAPTNFAPVTAPTAPVVQPVTMAPAGVTSAPAVPASTTLSTAPVPVASRPLDLNAIVGKLAGNTISQQQLGQVMVIGSIMGCTQKTAGKEATNAFYQEMQALGKTVEGYCKSGQPTLARSTVLNTLAAKQNDPVVKAVLTCYDAQKANVTALGGHQVAADAEHYSRWIKDPAAAKAEMQESDVCRKIKK